MLNFKNPINYVKTSNTKSDVSAITRSKRPNVILKSCLVFVVIMLVNVSSIMSALSYSHQNSLFGVWEGIYNNLGTRFTIFEGAEGIQAIVSYFEVTCSNEYQVHGSHYANVTFDELSNRVCIAGTKWIYGSDQFIMPEDAGDFPNFSGTLDGNYLSGSVTNLGLTFSVRRVGYHENRWHEMPYANAVTGTSASQQSSGNPFAGIIVASLFIGGLYFALLLWIEKKFRILNTWTSTKNKLIVCAVAGLITVLLSVFS